MMVGLQGSGKTTTTAKIAKRLTERDKRKVLMASLDTRRPAAMEQLAVLGQQVSVETLPIVAGQSPVQIAGRAIQAGRARRLRRGAARHRRPHHARRGDDERGGRGQARRRSRTKCCWSPTPDRPGRGQSRALLRRARRPHRHRADPRRRRRPRRRGAVDARRHRQADQADRHRRAAWTRWRTSIPPASPAASSAWATSSRWSRRPRPTIDAKRRCALAEKMRKGAVRSQRPARPAAADAEDGRHERPDGHDARHRQDQEPDRRAPISTTSVLKRQMAIIDSMTPGERKHPDVLKASRKKRIAAGSGTKVEEVNKLLKMHRDHGRHDEGDGRRQGARPDGRPRPDDGLRAAACRRRKRWRSSPRKLPGGAGGLPPNMPGGCRGISAGLPGLGAPKLPGLGGFPGLREAEMTPTALPPDFRPEATRRESGTSRQLSNKIRKDTPMPAVIRMARAGTKKRPFYHIVVADSRSPRDGRFIERLGYFNPLLPKDKAERLKLDLDKVKAWMAKGAQPSDRVDALPRCRRRRQARDAQQSGAGDCRARSARPRAKRRRRNAEAAKAAAKAAKAAAKAEKRRLPRPRRQTTLQRRGRPHLRRPDRRRARRARRGAAVVVHRRSAGDRRLRPAGERGRQPALRDRGAAAGEGSSASRGSRASPTAMPPSGSPISSSTCRATGCRRSRSGHVLSCRPGRACRGDCRTARALGTVIAVHNFGAGDMIEIGPAAAASRCCVPFTDAAVPVIDIARRLDPVDRRRRAAEADRPGGRR